MMTPAANLIAAGVLSTGSAVMDPFLTDWLNLLLRWGHMIAGISWIGTSFYFVALDFTLRRHANLAAGVTGEAWEVHGGGFYHVQKYVTAPAALPDHLTWFKWEAYLTWLTGFLLLIVQYYVFADSYLIDASVLALTQLEAIALSLVSLAGGWLIYDFLCRRLAMSYPQVLMALVFVLISVAAWGFTHIYSGRGAFIHVGTFIGTMMAANVFMVIIPNQRKITAALIAGKTPDPRYGAVGKQRSLHNTYLTLPVLLMMVSNHYAFLTGHAQSWILIGLIVVGGGALRHFLLRVEVGDRQDQFAWTLAVMAATLGLALYLTQPGPTAAVALDVSDETAMTIINTHCASCHSATPTDPKTKAPPKNIILQSPADIRRYGPQIIVQSVTNKAMPLGNRSKMTVEERAMLGAWIGRL
jgi:uncharacterized membrane protein